MYDASTRGLSLILFTDFTSEFCQLRREEAPGDPGFSLREEVAGPLPGRVHHERAFASPRPRTSTK